ncbi:YqaJ viral recombinase family protein [Gammaproteobacteria bacterium]|nr:YqaJ viral recombinase family protein [Gammaproteobacteria bacterium]
MVELPKIESIELEQNTEAWEQYRREHYNASEAAIILGIDPWRKERGTKVEPNEAIEHGHRYEPDALAFARDLFGVPELEPAVYRRGKFSASLDGITPDRSLLVEIKCPVKGSKSELWRSNRIPKNYMAQLAHQYAITEAGRCVFLVYCAFSRKAKTRDVPVDVLREFWWSVVYPAWVEYAKKNGEKTENGYLSGYLKPENP